MIAVQASTETIAELSSRERVETANPARSDIPERIAETRIQEHVRSHRVLTHQMSDSQHLQLHSVNAQTHKVVTTVRMNA